MGRDPPNMPCQPDLIYDRDNCLLQIDNTTATMTTAGHHPATQAARSRSAHEWRPSILRAALSLVPVNPEGDGHRPAGHGGALASGWFSALLALEIAKSGGPAADLR